MISGEANKSPARNLKRKIIENLMIAANFEKLQCIPGHLGYMPGSNQIEILELKITASEMKYLLDGFNSELNKSNEGIGKLEDRSVQMIQFLRMMRNEQQRPEGHQQASQHVLNGSPRRRWGGGEKQKNICIIAKNFPNLMKTINLHIPEAQQTTSRLNSKRSTSVHVIARLTKVNATENLQNSKLVVTCHGQTILLR